MIQRDQPTIFETAKVRVAVSSKADGNMKRECGDDAYKNIEHLVQAIEGDPSKVAALYVNDPEDWDRIHEVSEDEAVLQSPKVDKRIHADALITDLSGITLLLPIADCNPVVLHDPIRGVLALVHLGWQSTEAKLASKVVHFMTEHYRSRPQDILAYFGPSIKASSYVFSDRPRQADDPEWASFLHQEPGGTGIDLPGFNRRQLIDAGLRETSIEICPVDTATSNEYFSHYRAIRSNGDEPEGRFAVVCRLL